MIQQIAAGFFFIERGWLNGNHFVFAGAKKVLVDTGYITHFQNSKRWIEQAGVDLASVDLIISTHSHCDHVGGNRRIQDLSSCEIAMHPVDKASIDSKDDWATWYRFYDQEAEFFTVTQTLQEGDVVSLDGLDLQVLHTPGHARGGICLYSPQHRFLISADALWDGDVGVLNTIVEGQQAPLLALQSLDKLATLKVDMVYPGHGGVIHDPQGAIDRSRRRIETLMRDPARLGNDHLKKILVWTLLMKNGYPKETFFQYLMGGIWYPAVVDAFFEGRYRDKFDELIAEFSERGIVFIEDGAYRTTVVP